jgi:hypothetical protein
MLYGMTGFQVYAILAAVIVMWMQKEYDRVVLKEEQTVQPISLSEKRAQMYRYICISGFVGSTATTLSKSCAGMLVVTIGNWSTRNQFKHSFTYIILISWIYALTTWVKRMDRALRMFDSFAVVILQLVWTLYSIVQGGIYYQEFDSYGEAEYAFLALGLVMVCLGVYGLAPEQEPPPPSPVYEIMHDKDVMVDMGLSGQPSVVLGGGGGTWDKDADAVGPTVALLKRKSKEVRHDLQQQSNSQLALPGGNERPSSPTSVSSGGWENASADIEEGWQNRGGGRNESSSSSLAEMVKQVNDQVDQRRHGAGFGFSMPMNITTHADSRAQSEAGIASEPAPVAGSLPQMHRRMRSVVIAVREMKALSNRVSGECLSNRTSLEPRVSQSSLDGIHDADGRPASSLSESLLHGTD